MKNLVIVESPTKAKTIGKFLGKEYEIKFSMGHVMDLPKSKLGVDFEHDFTPLLEVVADKKLIISELKKLTKGADSVILATDPDREGEAIASNIQDLLRADNKGKDITFQRIVFHEITEAAVREALTKPRTVDTNLVDAQVARRVLDRLVGYQISPILWQKVRRGLSAGRVQSVALRLLVEREREIEKFKKEKYFSIHALLKKETKESAVEFLLIEIRGEKIDTQQKFTFYDGEYTVSKTTLLTPDVTDGIIADLEKKKFVVADVLQKETRRFPQPPYTTSTLQQDASRRFGYPGKRTMSLAQKLYEEGFITYHRTDSVTLSQTAIDAMRGYVKKEFGENYLPATPRVFSGKQKLAQEAHEGIRPTMMQRELTEIREVLGNDCAKLYDLIWRRALASQMADAVIESTTITVDAKESISSHDAVYRLKTNGSVLKFDGFLKINPQALQDVRLPEFRSGDELQKQSIRKEEHETSAPPRYNDASLIATLEEKGIGRPSTYASIISVLTDRAYVERAERRFVPTSVGMAVNDFLVQNFSTIDDIPFTAQMENDLDEVASGAKEWVLMMKEFYKPFGESLAAVKDAPRVKIETEDTGELCPECVMGNLVIRTGKFGKFLSCSRFPSCKFTKPFVEQTNIMCPKDNGNIIIKKTRTGRKFYGCSHYPNCNFAAWKIEDIKAVKREEVKVKEKPASVEVLPKS
ncbi:MAG: hypothetical protein RLZZ455_1110 [Candidatus Parcubacteria bacterium]|jgi:DNA topoisomerase-1